MMRNNTLRILLLFAAMMMASACALAACPGAHSYGSWWIKRQPTCMTEGLKFKDCNNCDHWEKATIRKLPHDIDNWTVTRETSCTQKGVEEGDCKSCGNHIKRYIDMIPHAYGEMVVAQEPTCLKNGRGEYTCVSCGRKKSETIPKLGHDYVQTSVKKEPTCSSTGTGVKTCQRCGRVQEGRIDKLTHVMESWTITKEPEGSNKGTRESVCTLCGETIKERFYWEGSLYEGMEPCEEVIRLQEMLRDLDFYSGAIRTGTFGELTGKSVSRFRTAHGLTPSVVADPETIALITSEWEKATGKSAADMAETPAGTEPAAETNEKTEAAETDSDDGRLSAEEMLGASDALKADPLHYGEEEANAL